MSENIPESIPTSADPRSQRPLKRARGPVKASSTQSVALERLFAQPDKTVEIPTSATNGVKTVADILAPPEIVSNVQGSSAGAGSGEFHVYKASRRRENERIRLMEAEAKREEADQAWKDKQEELRRKDETNRSKNAKRREKAKLRKQGIKPEPAKSQAKTTSTTEETIVGTEATKLKPNPLLQAPSPPASDAASEDLEVPEGATEEVQGIIMHDDD